jgi:NAD+ synthase (glutamine-hydrolysing)
VKICIAQLNPVVGDIQGNLERLVAQIQNIDADLIITPEMYLTGYPPEDLLFDRDFIYQASQARLPKGLPPVLMGNLYSEGDLLYNSAILYQDGQARCVHKKVHLPNYGVFDEKRYFTPGPEQPSLLTVGGETVVVTVCEDLWYPDGPHLQGIREGARVILNLSASPYHLGKDNYREQMLATRAVDSMAWVVYVNLVGGQDELVFDGQSKVLSPAGEVVYEAGAKEGCQVYELDTGRVNRTRLLDGRYRAQALGGEGSPLRAPHAKPYLDIRPESAEAELLDMLVMGIRDYVRKNGFQRVLIGMSGGIDSALVAALAARAVGSENVTCVSMPTRYNSQGTRDDARLQSEALGVEFREVAIQGILDTYPALSGTAHENLQARIRGTILMGISNSEGHLLLTTGNKSEVSVGYATLYGDTAGGFAPIKDLYKTQVYVLATEMPEVLDSIITRPPSAELRDGQADTDSLPAYDQLDSVLRDYLERGYSPSELVARYPEWSWVSDIVHKVQRAEYKRRQSPPGIKVSERAYGRDWRQPITRYTSGSK